MMSRQSVLQIVCINQYRDLDMPRGFIFQFRCVKILLSKDFDQSVEI